MKKYLRPPAYLSRPARELWRRLQSENQVEMASGLALLTSAAEAFDRARTAREAIERDGGPVVKDRFGQPKAHPACMIERDARSQFIAALRALGADPGRYAGCDGEE